MTYDKAALVFVPIPTNKTFKNLTGRKFTRHTILGFAGIKNSMSYWFCECICGRIKKVQAAALQNGMSQSCGCMSREQLIQRLTTHGLTHHPLRKTWTNIKSRCYNRKNTAYPNYGGRGIKVCDRWRESFKNFLDDMGESPFIGATVERVDNNKGYSPDNCEWANHIKQANNKRNNRNFTFRGKTQSLSVWARELRVSRSGLRYRLENNWNIEKAFTTPMSTKYLPKTSSPNNFQHV